MWGLGKKIVYHIQQFNPSKDYYKILGISKEATKDQIKKSFRDLAKKHHPDSNSGNEQKFKEINEAYQILSSQEIKSEYDASQNKHQQIKKSPPRPDGSKAYGSSRNYQRKYDNYKQNPGFKYDEDNPEQFRQYMRKQMNEETKKYTHQRNTYDNLGRTYQNYQQFKQYTLNKKKQAHHQKFKVTLDSVKKQQELYRAHRQARDRQQMQKKAQNLKKDLEQRYQRAKQNTSNTIEGIKRAGAFIKDFFTKK